MLGVGALIVDPQDRVLLVERGREPLKGYWSLPGGVLETGETLCDGIRREVFEETGLVVQPVRMAEVFERIMPDSEGKTEYHYVLVDYLCVVTGGELTPGDDVSAARWYTKPEVARLRLTEGTLGVIERVLWSERAPESSSTKS